MYAVIQPDGPTRGIVLSRHRTRAAAERSIEREQAEFRLSRHYQAGSWLDREIAACEPRATRAVRS